MAVGTPSHGGLRLSPTRWAQLPRELRDNFLNACWAEEDCEQSLVIAVLKLDPSPVFRASLEEFQATARQVARHFPRYSAALAYLPPEPEPEPDAPAAIDI